MSSHSEVRPSAPPSFAQLLADLHEAEEEARQEERQAEAARLLATGAYQARPDGKAGVWAKPKAQRPLCGAKTRAGGVCQARAVLGGKRCRLHGGASTGPTSEAGKARIAESNKRRARAKQADKV